MRRRNSGQTTAEYFILMAVILAALLAIGFISRTRGSFTAYFQKASGVIATNR